MAREKRTFEEWRRKVNAAVWRQVGLGLDDLPDVALYDWYEDGVAPTRAAARAIREADGSEF